MSERIKIDYEVGIIGAGFGGLVAALKLKASGRTSFVIFECASDIGGTWRDNIYPGCACDVPSHLYSIASEPNPDWNYKFSRQPEILNYLKEVVSRNDLSEHIRLNSDITELKFIESDGLWLATDRNGNPTRVKFIISAMGPLNRPVIPQIEGLETFIGQRFHSSEWDKTCDIKGKRVAVIGTGASAIQVVPNIASEVSHLSVFQRTPAWIAPRDDRKISRFGKTLFKYIPVTQKFMREGFYWFNEFLGKGFVGNKTIYNLSEFMALQKLKKEVKNPEIRRKLTPQYNLGCKRVLVSDDYYPTFNRPNVSLITASIEKITGNSIVTTGGMEHPVDIIVFATGFEAADIALYTKILDKNGVNLIDEWTKTGAQAYHGTTVSGYPNLALLLGPNTGLGHNSMIHIMESQMNYVVQYLDLLKQNGDKAYLNVKPEIQSTHNASIQNQFEGTVWASGCKSWYLNKNGRNTTLYPRLTVQFRKDTQTLNLDDYVIHHSLSHTEGCYPETSGGIKSKQKQTH